MPKIESEFAPVTPGRLCDRRYGIVHPPITRLYYFIVARSKRGTQPFELTNMLAAELGIDRHRKAELLKKLEQHGLVVVTRWGRASVWVSADG